MKSGGAQRSPETLAGFGGAASRRGGNEREGKGMEEEEGGEGRAGSGRAPETAYSR